jgi:hypothetical protein
MLLRNLILALLLPLPAAAQTDIRAFFFGNSLVHHLTDTDETAVPYWLDQLAEAGGHGFAMDGTWGFLQDFATQLPPEPGWSFDGVEGVLQGRAFRMADIDTVILTPPNFIQYQGADRPLDGDNPRQETPLGLATRTFDWVHTQAPGARLWVYEGWPDMGEIGFPPSDRRLRRYYENSLGDYHVWYEDFARALSADLGGTQVGLIPVSSVLARILTQSPLNVLDVTDLYTDDAPHGTPNLYFLASLVTYAVLYNEPPPADAPLPASLHPHLRAAYPLVADQVWAAVNDLAIPTEEAAVRPETGLENPALAMGLSGIADWSTQHPFIDLMKTARPWIGHRPGQWGGMEAEELFAGGYLDAHGWPLAIPEGIEAIETFILTDQPEAAQSLAGRYLVTWRGKGEISVGGIATEIDRDGDAISFSYRPGPGPVGIRLTAIDPEDPIRDIRVIRAEHADLAALGEVFNPAWIARIADLRSVRFMDWMMTNGSPQVTWDDRPRVEDFSWAWRGVPVEVMVRLSNEIGADPWFTLPHMADDAYVRAFAGVVHDTLDPDLKVYAEWSNEVWNWLFPQAAWARDRGVERWGEGDDHWMQYAGLRAAEVADIWTQVYSGESDRLVRVVGVHTGWLGLEDSLLDAPRAVAEGRPLPYLSFDAYAVTGYFGYEMGEERGIADLRRWLRDGDAPAELVSALYDGSLGELGLNLFPYHAARAERRGLFLTMYEGGTHLLAQGEALEDEAITDFFNDFNYSPEMGAIYQNLLTEWEAAGGTMFNAFVDVAAPSKWGSWGALRHLDDANPRWAALMDWNARANPDWEVRAPGTFAQGIYQRGTDAGETLAGSVEGDVILAGGGDDTIEAGHGDRVHGGAGRDLVLLPGRAETARLSWDGEVLSIADDWGRVTLVDVEDAAFAEDGGALLVLMAESGG